MVRFTALSCRIDEGIIGRLTREASYSGSVIRCRQLSRSSISPCEQVGEHHGGAAGCLASSGNGGILAGATDGGSEFAGFVVQPLASNISPSSSAFSVRSLFLSMRPHLLQRVGALLLLCPFPALAQRFSQAIAAVPGR